MNDDRDALDPRVVEQLARAQRLGFIGGDLDEHLDHARAFAAAVGPFTGAGLDLGAGGGLPGLVLVALRPDATWCLLDANDRRTAFLADAVETLGWADRVEVRRARAEDEGRLDERRGRFDLVVARSFGAPAVVAECAAPFLRVGGRLIVSEPPDGDGSRWPADGLAPLGLSPAVASPPGFQVLDQRELCPPAYPRRTGVPTKRPLFRT